jgi:hypothetical protein
MPPPPSSRSRITVTMYVLGRNVLQHPLIHSCVLFVSPAESTHSNQSRNKVIGTDAVPVGTETARGPHNSLGSQFLRGLSPVAIADAASTCHAMNITLTIAGDTDAKDVVSTDAKDVVPLEREGTTEPVSVGTAIEPSTQKAPKRKVIEIGKEVIDTPIVYRADNGKDQVLLRVPMSRTLPSFQKNMQRSNFVDNLLESLGPDTEVATKWLLGALAKKHGKIYEEVARERKIITT